MTLHALAAELLGWSEEQAASFSLRALRDVVRTCPPGKRRDDIIARINAAEESGRVVIRRR